MAAELVLLHGFTHTGASWDAVIGALGERYSARAPDIRGHGSASDVEPVTLDAVLGDLAPIASRRLTLCGYSMGGRIALHAALADQRRVERLVLIGASPGIAEEPERAARREADERLATEIEHSTIEEFARRWAANPVLAGQPAGLRERVHEDRLRSTTGGLARALRGLGTGALPSLWDRLAELEMPVELIVGERDHKFVQIAGQMAAAIPAAAITVVPSCGHAVHLENPRAAAEVISGARGTSR